MPRGTSIQRVVQNYYTIFPEKGPFFLKKTICRTLMRYIFLKKNSFLQKTPFMGPIFSKKDILCRTYFTKVIPLWALFPVKKRYPWGPNTHPTFCMGVHHQLPTSPLIIQYSLLYGSSQPHTYPPPPLNTIFPFVWESTITYLPSHIIQYSLLCGSSPQPTYPPPLPPSLLHLLV